ncbi:MAG TPA: response regulator [Burkholderiales bacterium]|jgi:DNA-binding NarL/FixJ family response regulator
MDVFVVDASPRGPERLAELLASIPQVRLVGQADSARAAIAAILAKKPDVVLLSLRLAEGTGFQVLGEVRRREPGIDFYVLSNFSAEPFRRRAEQLGALRLFSRNAGLQPVRDLIAARAGTVH